MSNTKPYRLIRQIDCFNLHGNESLVFEESLGSLSSDEIKEMLNIGGENDPNLLDAYLIPEDRIVSLQPFLTHKADPKKYKYFYGCYAKYFNEE